MSFCKKESAEDLYHKPQEPSIQKKIEYQKVLDGLLEAKTFTLNKQSRERLWVQDPPSVCVTYK